MVNALKPTWIVATSGLLLALQPASLSAAIESRTNVTESHHQPSRVKRSPYSDVSRPDLSLPVQRFSVELLKAMDHRDQFIVSPLGLSIMLNIMLQGAIADREDRHGANSAVIKRSLQTVFGYDHKWDHNSIDHKWILYEYNKLISDLEDDGSKASFLNMLILQRFAESPNQVYDRKFEQSTEFYRAKLESWNWPQFNSDEDTWKGTAIDTVNKWIKQHGLSDKNKLDADTIRDGAWEDGAMALSGAAFEYRWADEQRFLVTRQGNFQAMGLTKARFFESARGEPKQPQNHRCPQSDRCLSYYNKYLSHLDEFAALELPLNAKGYGDRRRTSLILIEPSKPASMSSMKRLAEQLMTVYYNNCTNLQIVLDALDCEAANFQMNVEIPKFKQEADTSLDMKALMTEMQMAGVFERGNYRQMLCGVKRVNECVYLNEFRHMTMIDVGPTGINVDRDQVNFDEAVPEEPLDPSVGSNLRITYPFMYFVVRGNIPLLMGQVASE